MTPFHVSLARARDVSSHQQPGVDRKSRIVQTDDLRNLLADWERLDAEVRSIYPQLAAERAKVNELERKVKNQRVALHALQRSYEVSEMDVRGYRKLAGLRTKSDALADIRREVARECAEIVKAGRIDSSERTLSLLRKLASIDARLCLDTIVEEIGYCAAQAICARFGVTE